jgi:hypothetical protein
MKYIIEVVNDCCSFADMQYALYNISNSTCIKEKENVSIHYHRRYLYIVQVYVSKDEEHYYIFDNEKDALEKYNSLFPPKPYYEHDCPTCEFLGHTSTHQDVYFCFSVLHKSLLVRYSDEPAYYQCVYSPHAILEGHKEAWNMMLAKGYTLE